MIILSGQSNRPLAQEIAQSAGAEWGEVEIGKFKNGEKQLRILAEVTNQDVVIVQSLYQPVDEHIMEMLLLIDAADRAGAEEITLVIPWLGYSLQDKVFLPGQPLSARVVANLVSSQRVARVFLLDLHNPSIPGFFSVPTRILSSNKLFAAHVRQNFVDPIVVSPDFGGLKRARTFAEMLDAPLSYVDKTRDLITGEVTVNSIVGSNPEGRSCIVVDDIISTGSTVMEVAEQLHRLGAKEVVFYATHGLFVQDALDKLEDGPIDHIVVTNSVPLTRETSFVSQVSVADLISHELRHLHQSKK